MGSELSGVGVVSDFLLELRCEEIPARMQAGARAELEKLFRRELVAAGVVVGDPTIWSTPRRLALIARGLPLATEAVSEEAKGPPEGAPDAAIDGFCRKAGVERAALELRDVKGRMTYFAVIEQPGRAMADVLTAAIPAIIRDFSWPKSMRWGAASIATESLRWVRPLSGIVALLDGEVVPCEVDGIASGRETAGHRFHHEGPITIGNADDYAEKLRACHVIVDHEERAAIIRNGAAQAAVDAGLKLVADEGLVIENAGLTEWPVPLLGRFDEAFLDVPPEVIQLTARVNQKYFVCEDADGKLANAFVCTANIDAIDPAVVVDGNRKVLAARLSDARFFWEQDQKKTLAEHAKGLARITFHEKLGTVADKVDRVAKLARWLVEEGIVKPTAARPEPVEGPSLTSEAKGRASTSSARTVEELANMAEQAARLCKADLVTEMVGEFPELQGLMGGYYAAKEGLPPEVAAAIRDHYKPVGQGDYVPTAPVTVAVSLADKLDSLCQFFLIDEAPTGSKDPFALRRAAIGVISLILGNSLRFRMQDVLLKAVDDDLTKFERVFFGHTEKGLGAFFADRLKVQQREAGVRHDLIDAVFALGGEDDLVRLLARVHALQAFVTTEDGANLLAGYKRAANILKKE
ncbi:MAG: glycine--tRNA ligase subunit beta, partial [Erythrobacter sp.]|nr:glycine--tRNA ligase subunit beta [Erythrobacter sp.]